jgi:hypothetical protein
VMRFGAPCGSLLTLDICTLLSHTNSYPFYVIFVLSSYSSATLNLVAFGKSLVDGITSQLAPSMHLAIRETLKLIMPHVYTYIHVYMYRRNEHFQVFIRSSITPTLTLANRITSCSNNIDACAHSTFITGCEANI